MWDPLSGDSRLDATRWRKTSRLQALCVVAGLALVLAAVAYLWIRPNEPAEPVELAVPTERPESRAGSNNVSRAVSTDPDASYRQLAIGTWQDFHHGKRTLILRDDGTAMMVVELSGIKARLFTRRLELDIAWSIEDGKMHRRTVGGRPRDKVDFVNKRAGVAVAEPIIELTEESMILLDQNGSQQYHWRRVQ